MNFGQIILFQDLAKLPAVEKVERIRYITPVVRQDYETPLYPCGLLWTLELMSSHSDPYYIGLDGIEILDVKGKPLDVLTSAAVTSIPQSITDLGLSDPEDDRRVRNLFLRTQLVFLSPLSRNITEEERRLCVRVGSMRDPGQDRAFVLPKHNTIFVMFDFPTTVSGIR